MVTSKTSKTKTQPRPTFLAAGEVCALAGIYQTLLDRWVTLGWIHPEHAAGGRGAGHRRFTTIQAIAIVYAAAYRRAGASVPWTQAVINWVQQQNLDNLKSMAQDSSLALLPLPQEHHGPQVITIPNTVSELSLQTALTKVLNYLQHRGLPPKDLRG